MSHLISRLPLDEATGNSFFLSSQVEELSKAGRNVSKPLPERVTHFVEIIRLDVGNRSLNWSRNIERQTGHPVVHAYQHEYPDFIVIQGRSRILNPAYPDGLEMLAAGLSNAATL